MALERLINVFQHEQNLDLLLLTKKEICYSLKSYNGFPSLGQSLNSKDY